MLVALLYFLPQMVSVAQAEVMIPLSFNTVNKTYCRFHAVDNLRRRATLLKTTGRGAEINISKRLRRRRNLAIAAGRPAKAARLLQKHRALQQNCRERQLALMSCTATLSLGVKACINSGYILPQEECVDSGGEFGLGFFVGIQFCNPQASDAGSPCNSSSDCESVCVASSAGPGDAASGSCYGSKHAVGVCMSLVEEGVVQPVVCFE